MLRNEILINDNVVLIQDNTEVKTQNDVLNSG